MSREGVAVALVFVLALVLGSLYLQLPHSWGDDFAGYLLQARSLVEGHPAAEVLLNGELQRAGDWRVGPDAYPWGFPLILAALHPLVGWNLTLLNLIGVASLLLVVIATVNLAHRAGLYALGTVAAVALTVWQPTLIAAVSGLASDLPFLACSMGALLAIDALMGPGRDTGPRFGLVLLAVVLAVAAFAIRSNGAIVVGTLGFALCVNFAQGGVKRSRATIELGAFVLLTGLGVLANFKGLPDGSLVHVSYLSLEPSSIIARINGHFDALGQLVPVNVLPHVLRPVGVLALLALCLGGAWTLGGRGLTLLAYIGGHLLLLTVFKFEGGMRYYFPLMPVIAVLAVTGAGFFYAAAIRAEWSRALRNRPLQEIATAALLLVVAGLSTWITLREVQPAASGPYTASSIRMVQEVQVHFPADARVSFFKPRALRWLSGRQAVLIREAAHLDTVDGVVLLPLAGTEFQLDAAQVEASGQFDLAWHDEQFQLYTRKLSQPRPTRP